MINIWNHHLIGECNRKDRQDLTLLRPVSVHAGFVDDLKTALYQSSMVRMICGSPKVHAENDSVCIDQQ